MVHRADAHTSSPFHGFLGPSVFPPNSHQPTPQACLVLSPGQSQHPRLWGRPFAENVHWVPWLFRGCVPRVCVRILVLWDGT